VHTKIQIKNQILRSSVHDPCLSKSVTSPRIQWRFCIHVPDVCNIENWIKFSFMDIYDMDWYGNRSRIIKILFFTSVYIYILVGGFKHFLFSMIYGNNPSHWLIFFRGVETTNQIYIYIHCRQTSQPWSQGWAPRTFPSRPQKLRWSRATRCEDMKNLLFHILIPLKIG
jgi:hypothetical protein